MHLHAHRRENYHEPGVCRRAGRVVVLRGTTGGLTTAGAPTLDGSRGGTLADCHLPQFGASLAVGRINGNSLGSDSFDELVVGAPFATVLDGNVERYRAGRFYVFAGSAAGLTTAGAQEWNQGSWGIEGSVEDGDNLGWALTVADFNGDGFDDVAAGVPHEWVGGVEHAGAVNVLFGGPSLLSSTGNLLLAHGGAGMSGTSERLDYFGSALAPADLDGDGLDDLIIGAYFKSPDLLTRANAHAGVFHFVPGSDTGLNRAAARMISRSTPGVPGELAGYGQFAYSLAAGDVDGDGAIDLIVGSPGEDWSGLSSVGVIQVLHRKLLAGLPP
ncbi:MAG TPA: FG-GAP repeat protein [Thermoanaerobaculia bacterium]|nr:FG-GAP repeat protein [Thermoanaerobaculia bacterium]